MRNLLAFFLALGLLSSAETKLGKPLTVNEPMPLATLLAHPDDYVGKVVQVAAVPSDTQPKRKDKRGKVAPAQPAQ